MTNTTNYRAILPTHRYIQYKLLFAIYICVTDWPSAGWPTAAVVPRRATCLVLAWLICDQLSSSAAAVCILYTVYQLHMHCTAQPQQPAADPASRPFSFLSSIIITILYNYTVYTFTQQSFRSALDSQTHYFTVFSNK